jgi:FkbM family methyltransferase
MLTLFKDTLRPWYHLLKNKNYRTYYGIFSSYGSLPRYKKTTIRFQGLTFDVPDALSFIYQYREIFVDESYWFKCKTDEPLILDCGANVGLSSYFFKSLYPNATVKAFEADPSIFQFLKSNINANLPSGSVECINKAIWVDDAGISFNPEGADGGSITKTEPGKLHVDSVRLRDLLVSERIDFLKIDIEGAEYEVLLDCDGHFQNVERLFFEYHSHRERPQHLDELLAIVSRNGFRYFIQSPSLSKSPFLSLPSNEPMDLQLNIYCYKPEKQ